MASHMTPAEVVTAELGVRPLARDLEVSPTTVWRWRACGLVPSQYHVAILEIAKRERRKLTERELIHGREA